MKIIFMGTPDFAVPSLQKLIESKHEVMAVFTKQPKRSNRGYKLQKTPIHELAEKNNVEVFTPKTFKIEKNILEVENINPDLIVVVAYGLILPQKLLDIPKFGCINIHPSLLPKYRGCAPMERCLMSNDTETGVCIIKIMKQVDAGDVIKSVKIPINKETDIIYLKNKLSELGSNILLETIDNFENGNFSIEYKQDNSLATFTEKITNDDAIIDWKNDSVIKIHKKIMALCDSITVVIKHNNSKIKILRSDYELKETINTDNLAKIIDKKFTIQCKDGVLKPIIVQKEGKKAMDIKSFLNGYRFEIGDFIE